MRVGIDVTPARAGRLTGVERYAVELVRALAARAPGEVVLFTGPGAPEAIRRLDVEQHRAPLEARLPVDQLWLPLTAARARVDLLHTLAFPTPLLWRSRSILTMHDATPWLFPQTASKGMRLYYRPLFPQALRRATMVLTPSMAARADVARATGVPQERILVAPEGVRLELFTACAAPATSDPYLLCVGTVEPRKNLATLFDAFRILVRQGRRLDLVLVGRRGWGRPLDPGDIAPRVQFTGAVDDARLADYYSGAACFVLPSLYEGFGLPLLEAMAAGTPAVASGIPALRELAGETVRYADPRDTGAFAAAIAATLDGGEETLARVRAARARAATYTWDRCADVTLAAYRKALEDPA